MKKGIVFEVGTTNFTHAIETLEVAFDYEGSEWDKIKLSNSMELWTYSFCFYDCVRRFITSFSNSSNEIFIE